MKSIIYGIATAVALVGTANALTTEEIKQRCLQSEEYAWDAKNSLCVYRNACKFEPDHCNRVFKDVQVGKPEHGETLVRAYLNKHGYGVDSITNTGSATFGQDYVRVFLTDGSYVEFEFDDLHDMEYNKDFIPLDYWCIAFDGIVSYDNGHICKGITKQECDEITGGQGVYSEMDAMCDFRNVKSGLL